MTNVIIITLVGKQHNIIDERIIELVNYWLILLKKGNGGRRN